MYTSKFLWPGARYQEIWKPRDRDEIGRIEKRVGLEKGMLKTMFDMLVKDEHDSITVDHTRNSPSTLRLNLFQPIEIDAES